MRNSATALQCMNRLLPTIQPVIDESRLQGATVHHDRKCVGNENRFIPKRHEPGIGTRTRNNDCLTLPVWTIDIVRRLAATRDNGNLSFHDLLARHCLPTFEFSNITKGSIFHAVRAQLLDQLGEAAHRSASNSATIASMETRSSRWRSTMPAIRVLSSTMSTCSRVSSGST